MSGNPVDALHQMRKIDTHVPGPIYEALRTMGKTHGRTTSEMAAIVLTSWVSEMHKQFQASRPVSRGPTP